MMRNQPSTASGLLLDEVSFWDLLSEYVLVRSGATPSAQHKPRFERFEPQRAAAVVARTLSRTWPHADWHLLHFLGIDARTGITARVPAGLQEQLLAAQSFELYRRVREPSGR
jgi:hypothetical protein